jgi:hypothetical protein
MLHDLIVGWYGETTYDVFAFIFKFYPIWLPVISGIVFWELWVRYVRYYAFFNTKTVVLEIRLPNEQFKSPVAMDLALTTLFQTGGETTFIDRYWEGKTRPWYSLEIVSNGGDIRFYIWARENTRNVIEAQLYSQYPGAEVRVVEDYAKNFDFDPAVNQMWACNYDMIAPDPYPIKTYVDYGLDRDPKEEFKHDPLTPVLEYLGTMKPGEHIWLQFIIRAHKNEKRGGIFSSPSDWKQKALDERDKILKEIYSGSFGNRRSTPGENEVIEALERSVRKMPFDYASRAIYHVDNKELYRQTVPNAMRTLMNPFNSPPGSFPTGLARYNGFKRNRPTSWDFPWEDFNNLRLDRRKRRYLDGYKRRMAFFPPYSLNTFVLNTEELATIYHLPGAVASTPGLNRIPSKRAQAPSNLPV